MKKYYMIKLKSFDSKNGWSEDFIKDLVFNDKSGATEYVKHNFGTSIDGTKYTIIEMQEDEFTQININEDLLLKYCKNLRDYSSLLKSANESLLGKCDKKLTDEEDSLYQQIEAFDNKTKMLTEINEYLQGIPPILRYLIVLNEHIVPNQLEIMKKWHDIKTN